MKNLDQKRERERELNHRSKKSFNTNKSCEISKLLKFIKKFVALKEILVKKREKEREN